QVADSYVAAVLKSSIPGKETIAAILDVAARMELTRIALRRRSTPAPLELEVKVHGAKKPAGLGQPLVKAADPVKELLGQK
ncbi:MAG: hypothetical protein KGR26_15450, partial [Cyanobacteria bacterium REEB65]|nr:hypothetical protein [Cyanobacteria bacterium REEB65]